MSSPPIPAKPRCDVLGCGHLADFSTDGTEVDIQGLSRPSVKGVNVCQHHQNWPHSDDAKRFVESDDFKKAGR